jgi:hypothetical protein
MMQRLPLAIAAALVAMMQSQASAAPIGGVRLQNADGGGAPLIEKVVLCDGVGWRGPGYYPSLLGLRPACWDTLPYGGPVYAAPAIVAAPPAVYLPPPPPSATWFYCDDPKGYYPSVQTCTSGWRALPAAP